MSTFFSNMANENTDVNDNVLVSNMLASSELAANAYLNATLLCSTPELRAIYSASLSQIIAGHGAVTELAVNNGYTSPYASPTNQLADAYHESKTVTEKDR